MTETLSQDVLEQIGRETAHAARKATDRRMRHWAAAAGTAFLLLLGGIINNSVEQNRAGDEREHAAEVARNSIVKSSRAVAVSGCNRDYARDEKFVALLRRLRDGNDVQYKRGRIDIRQHAEAQAFYDEQIEAFRLPDCRESEKLLTDDPTDWVRVPAPLHP